MELQKKEIIRKNKLFVIFSIISFILGIACILLTGNVVFLSEYWSVNILKYLGSFGPIFIISFFYNFMSLMPLFLGIVGGLLAILSHKKGLRLFSFLGFCLCLIGLMVTLLFAFMKNIKFFLSLINVNYSFILYKFTWIFRGMPL